MPVSVVLISHVLSTSVACNVLVPARADKLSMLVISVPKITVWPLALIVTLSFKPAPPSMSPEI